MDILSKVQERIKELMLERNYNASRLAETLGVSASTVSRYVNSVSLPTYQQFLKLLVVFECPADYLLGLTDEVYEKVEWKKLPPFSERFRTLLDERKMSQYALHKKTGFSYDNFNKWLKGMRSPYLDNLVKLAQAFDCTVDYLIGRV